MKEPKELRFKRWIIIRTILHKWLPFQTIERTWQDIALEKKKKSKHSDQVKSLNI